MIFSRARTEAPEFCGVAQLSFAFVDIKINGLWRSASEDDTVVPRRFEIRRPVTASLLFSTRIEK